MAQPSTSKDMEQEMTIVQPSTSKNEEQVITMTQPLPSKDEEKVSRGFQELGYYFLQWINADYTQECAWVRYSLLN